MSFSLDKIINKLFLVNLFAIFFGAFILLIKYSSLPNLVPLFYNRPWGNEQLVLKYYLWGLPSLSLVVFLTDLLLANISIRKAEKFLATILTSFSLLFSLLATISLIKIIFLVG